MLLPAESGRRGVCLLTECRAPRNGVGSWGLDSRLGSWRRCPRLHHTLILARGLPVPLGITSSWVKAGTGVTLIRGAQQSQHLAASLPVMLTGSSLYALLCSQAAGRGGPSRMRGGLGCTNMCLPHRVLGCKALPPRSTPGFES